MKNYFTTVLVFCFIMSNAQRVGINTNSPNAALDVNGNLLVRTIPDTDEAPNYNYLVINAENEVEKINGNFASATNTTIAKVVANTGISLLAVGAFGDWKKINFAAAPINPGGNFSTSADVYVVPSTGVYEINYYFKYGTGVTANILGQTQIGIFKQTAAETPTDIDIKGFTGVTLATVPLPVLPDVVVGLTITNTEINSIYQLTEGEKISFEINSGGIGLSLLGSSVAQVVVKKISN